MVDNKTSTPYAHMHTCVHVCARMNVLAHTPYWLTFNLPAIQ